MALVVLLRGVNVGGHRSFRPSQLAHELRRFDMVNISAAGTFVVRRPRSRREFRAALSRALPVVTEIVLSTVATFVVSSTPMRLDRSPRSLAWCGS